MAPITTSTADREANLLAVLVLGLGDRIRRAEEAAAGHGAAAPAALVALHEFLDGTTIDKLHEVVGLTPSGTVRLVDKLSGAGLVVRRPASDARAVSVVLTRAGHARAKTILRARRRAVESLLDRLSETERATLTSTVERLLVELTITRLEERQTGDDPRAGWLCRLCDFSACGRPNGDCPVATTADPGPEHRRTRR